MIVKLCRHCRSRKANRSRGLCWTCYYTPGLRDLYPPASRHYGCRLVDDFCRPALLPEPTDELPGPDKVPVLEERAARGLALFHPEDARRAMR